MCSDILFMTTQELYLVGSRVIEELQFNRMRKLKFLNHLTLQQILCDASPYFPFGCLGVGQREQRKEKPSDLYEEY